MKKISYRPVYNRKKQLNLRGTALLQVEAYLDRKKIYFSTHIYLSPQEWDTRRQMIVNHPHADTLNMMLRDFMLELERKELDLWKNGQEVTLHRLKDEFHTRISLSFLEFVKKDITSSTLKLSTQKNRFTTYDLLMRYNSGITFKDLTPKFVYDFERFLYENGLHMNTVAKHMKHLKSFVNAAINKGYLAANDYPFRRYRIKTKDGKHAFLLPEEVEKLEALTTAELPPGIAHTLDVFLFCCYTGIRYSDFRSLSEDNIQRIEGKPWLVFRTQKTDTEVKLPVTLLFEGKAWTMLKKYRDCLHRFFSVGSNSNMNKQLMRLGQLAGIGKHFSFHSARHTNATLLIYKGANITTVQKLLGHRDLSTTQIYSDVMESTIVRDLKKCAKSK
ncbi:MAG: site-specific integrase [Bacteroides sp.]|nr:site-specific integrase [Bacteroides sp.]